MQALYATIAAGSFMPREASKVVTFTSHKTINIVVKVLEVVRWCVTVNDLMENGFHEAVGLFQTQVIVGVGVVGDIIYFKGRHDDPGALSLLSNVSHALGSIVIIGR